MAIGVGIAEMLGYDAVGIELDPNLAQASRRFLESHGLCATIHTGSYYDIDLAADWYFVYCWPGQMWQVEAHFFQSAPVGARLLICHGAGDIRCKVRGR